ncbi:hypothetical protein [Haliscomenobacter hydrossis]|nr:hypothetical protein [Haliscomenobacter hydrossis]
MTREQLATEIGCHPRTLKRKLQKLGFLLPSGLVSAKNAQEIKVFLLNMPIVKPNGQEEFTHLSIEKSSDQNQHFDPLENGFHPEEKKRFEIE